MTQTYTTVADAKTALENSGVFEWFDYDMLDEVAEWMYRNDASAEAAATHFGVE